MGESASTHDPSKKTDPFDPLFTLPRSNNNLLAPVNTRTPPSAVRKPNHLLDYKHTPRLDTIPRFPSPPER